MAAKPFSVRIFVVSGEPEGLRIVEKSNWTGHGLFFPRALYQEAKKREEMTRTGVYILWGPGEDGQFPQLYVGEGDVVRARLDSHVHQKDFWTHGLIFTSKDGSLNKAHVRCLESRLIQLAAEAKRCDIQNGTAPPPPPMSIMDMADAEAFLADMLLCLPVLNLNLFERPKIVSTGNGQADKQPRLLYLRSRSKGVEATGFESAEGFVVKKGSTAARKEVQSFQKHLPYMSNLRRTLIKKGVLEDAGDVYRVTQDYLFNSSSAASDVLLGSSSSGPSAWKDASGRTLKELQAAEGEAVGQTPCMEAG